MKIVSSPVYLDTSALAKIYVNEPESADLESALVGRRDLIVSDLAVTELVSAIARRGREGQLSIRHAQRLYERVVRDVTAAEYRRAELTLAGFLPPNIEPPEGEGSVVFTVQPKHGLPTGTEIRNQARVVFDVNPPIDTPEWRNTIDNSPPRSHVLPLPATQPDPDVRLQWEGSDEGAGIATYTVYVSANGGAFTPLVSETTDTAVTFTGRIGETYAFCSIATDLVGNVEAKQCPPQADTSTVIGPPPAACAGDCSGDGAVTVDELVLMVNVALGNAPVSPCLAGDDNHDGAITVDEIVRAVNNALEGCDGKGTPP